MSSAAFTSSADSRKCITWPLGEQKAYAKSHRAFPQKSASCFQLQAGGGGSRFEYPIMNGTFSI